MTSKFPTLLALIAIPAAQVVWAQATAVPNVSIDPTTRTVTTSNFQVTWNTGVDTEAITALIWMAGSNVTDTYELDTCPDGGNSSMVRPAPCLRNRAGHHQLEFHKLFAIFG